MTGGVAGFLGIRTCRCTSYVDLRSTLVLSMIWLCSPEEGKGRWGWRTLEVGSKSRCMLMVPPCTGQARYAL